MEKSGNHVAEHVRSAKMWLEKAEESFDKKADIQGELNLMLAEAEMKNLRKHHEFRLWEKLRVVAVLVISVACIGIWYGVVRYESSPSLSVEKTVQKAETASDEPAINGNVPAAVPEPYMNNDSESADQMEPAASFETGYEAESPAPAWHEAEEPATHNAPASKEILTEEQMQQAVQDARHSLRGTEAKNK